MSYVHQIKMDRNFVNFFFLLFNTLLKKSYNNF